MLRIRLMVNPFHGRLFTHVSVDKVMRIEKEKEDDGL